MAKLQSVKKPVAAPERPQATKPAPDTAQAAAPGRMRISPYCIASATKVKAPKSPYTLPKPAPGVLPSGENIAMDSDPDLVSLYRYAGQGAIADGQHFMGYAALAELAQRAEYRRMVDTLAQDMTSAWIRLSSKGGGNKSNKIARMKTRMDELCLRDTFRHAAVVHENMGRAQLFVDCGQTEGPELETPLLAVPEKLPLGGLKGIRVIEPMWTYPGTWNARNPLAEDFYRPDIWFCMGQRVHATRLLTMVGRPVPDILKPAYMFGGCSLTQLAKPYVDYWLRTRSSVGDLLESFTIWVLKTNLAASLGGEDTGEMALRAELFNRFKSARGLMMIDKESEELENVSAPLAGLHELQAQSQEHMTSVDGMPVVKFFGTQPTGLNASSQGEIDCWHEHVHSYCEHLFRPSLNTVLNLIQMSEFGEIDPDIIATFEPLDAADPADQATERKTKADTAAVYISASVISPEEERERLAHEEDGDYANLDLTIEIDKPADADMDPADGTAGAAEPAPGAAKPVPEPEQPKPEDDVTD